MAYRQVILSVCAVAQVVLLSSPLTPFPLSCLLPALPATILPPVLLSQPPIVCPSVLFDYSYVQQTSQVLLETCPESLFLGMYLGCPAAMAQGRVKPATLAREIARSLVNLGFKRLFLAYTATPFYQDLAQQLSSTPELAFTHVISLHPALSLDEVDSFVGRILKPAGSLTAALLLDESTSQHLASSLTYYRLTGSDYVYFLSFEAAWTAPLEGALYVTERIAVNATTREDYEGLLLQERMEQVSKGVLQELPLALVNIVNGRPEVVHNYSIPTLQRNTDLRPKIPVSSDLKGVDYDGTVYPSGQVMTRGLALGYSQGSDLLPNFHFTMNTVTLGAQYYNASWAQTQLQSHWGSMGIAYHPFGFSTTVMNICDLFAKKGVQVPVSAICTGTDLSNHTRFPMFLRTMSSGAASAVVMIRFFQLFQWKCIAIINSDEASQVAFYQYLLSLASQHNIEIINNATLHQVPLIVSNHSAQLNATLQEIMTSTVRVIVMAHSQSYLIAERMYDLGARAGDYMVCLYYGLSYTQFGGADAASRKRRNVMRGAMMFYDRYFAGLEGPRVKELLQQADGDHYDPVSCVLYDTAMLVVHAVSFMMAKGQLYEDGAELMRVMRSTRFNGCLGVIQIEPDTNDRRAGDYSVLNLQLSGENDTLKLVDSALYSPTRTQLFTLLPALTFPDGSHTSFHDSWPLDPVCPYLAKDLTDFPAGRTLLIILSFLYTGTLSLMTWLIWRTFWRVPPLPLTQPTQMTIEDGLFLFSLTIEHLQLLALGPELPGPALVANSLNVGSVLLDETVSYTQGVFWLVEGLALGLAGSFVLLVTVKLLDLDSRLKRCYLCLLVGNIADFVAPLIGNTLLIPILLILFHTFLCDRALSDDFNDSLLSRDCYETCWNGTHLRYAISAAIFLCIYPPLAVFTRPLWQELHEHLHLRDIPSHLVGKWAVQLILVSAYISLRHSMPSEHAELYISVLAAYLLFSLRFQAYNYERLNLWKCLTLGGLLCYGAAGVLQGQGGSWVWAGVLGVWAVLSVVGVAAQAKVNRFKSLLIRRTEDRSDIIKFAFTFGSRADTHLRDFKAKSVQRHYIDCSSEIVEEAASRRIPSSTALHGGRNLA